MAFTIMRSLQADLKRDDEYLRYRAILRTVRVTMNLDKVMKEASFLHRNRKSRMLFEMRVSPLKLQDAVLNDMSNRSRLVEIKMLLLNQQELITTAIKAGKRHVRATYPDQLKEFGATKEAQLLVVDKVFATGIDVQAQIDSAIEILEMFVKDIDQSSYGLRNVTDTLKMTLERKDHTV